MSTKVLLLVFGSLVVLNAVLVLVIVTTGHKHALPPTQELPTYRLAPPSSTGPKTVSKDKYTVTSLVLGLGVTPFQQGNIEQTLNDVGYFSQGTTIITSAGTKVAPKDVTHVTIRLESGSKNDYNSAYSAADHSITYHLIATTADINRFDSGTLSNLFNNLFALAVGSSVNGPKAMAKSALELHIQGRQMIVVAK